MSGKRLNYNKWDSLQLSDDSDIEVHPNVDKKSMIRWKQRDIHEKREMRKLKLHHLGLEKIMNEGLLVRVRSLIDETATGGPPFISRTVEELRVKVPDYEGKQFKDGEQPSEDHMILSLLIQVVNKVGQTGSPDDLVKELKEHERKLIERQFEVENEERELEEEGKKYITSDDLHVGFESKTLISDKPSAAPDMEKEAQLKAKSKKSTTTTTVIETINSPSNSTIPPPSKPTSNSDSSHSDSDADAAPLTPTAHTFSLIKPLDWTSAFQAISNHPELLTEDTTDALLVEAFSTAMKGGKKNEDRARQCVEKGLVVQYCRSLGKDGVALFFRRMTASDPKALKIFLEDVATTSSRIIARAKVVAAEQAAERASAPQSEREQIQLVASSPSTTISFDIPDGPPPEHLVLEGEGSESLDIEKVREFLQRRWDIFQNFPKGLRKALEKKELEGVNKVLGKMAVDEAEEVVELLQEAGILGFSEAGVRDMTGKGESEGENELA